MMSQGEEGTCTADAVDVKKPHAVQGCRSLDQNPLAFADLVADRVSINLVKALDPILNVLYERLVATFADVIKPLPEGCDESGFTRQFTGSSDGRTPSRSRTETKQSSHSELYTPIPSNSPSFNMVETGNLPASLSPTSPTTPRVEGSVKKKNQSFSKLRTSLKSVKPFDDFENSISCQVLRQYLDHNTSSHPTTPRVEIDTTNLSVVVPGAMNVYESDQESMRSGSMRMGSRRPTLNIENIRRIADEQLVEKQVSLKKPRNFSDDHSDPFWTPCTFLKICGILPWKESVVSAPIWNKPSAWYQCLVLASGLFIATARTYHLLKRQLDHSWNRVGLLSDLPLAFGCVIGVVSLNTNSRLRECCKLLRSFTEEEDLAELWASMTCVDMVAMLFLWVLVILERIRGCLMHGSIESEPDAWLNVITFAFSSFMLVSLAFCMLYVSGALTTIVTGYCEKVIGERTLVDAIPNWNVVQAILRKVSLALQSCLFVLQATVLFTVLLGAVDVYLSKQQQAGKASLLIPGALLTLGLSGVFFRAATVTAKCDRVPSFINSCNFGEDIDNERMHVVEYVIHSAAGFYVYGIRLTSQMAWKLAYVFVLGMFTLLTQIVGDG